MSKQFLIAMAVCVLALFGIYALTSDNKTAEAPENTTGSTLSNNVTGKNAKKVSLVEYGDFQCSACGQYHPLVKQIIDKYGNDIQFQFRNYPIQSLHPNARAASRAAEAAAKQNKYWEMHDLLFEQQASWEASSAVNTIFDGYASQLKLDTAKFKKDFASSEVNKIITADFNEGTKLGVNSTPTFFLQGKKIENPQTLEDFNKLIDEAIKNAK